MSSVQTASGRRRRRALVLGGGFAGLLTARMLTSHFDEIVVLERDAYVPGPEPRSGTPQDRHVHLLLLRGRKILERYFPGIGHDLVRHGGCVLDPSRSLSVLNYHGWAVRYPSDMQVITFTRPLLDWCMRRRTLADSRIRIIEECCVTGLEGHDNAIVGVRCRSSNTHEADFVVDATGRFGRTTEWLSEVGCERPTESVVDPQLGYATGLLERSSELEGRAEAVVLFGKPPDMTRGGVLLPVENQRWVATLVGVGGDYPPTDWEGFVEFARTLRSSAIHRILMKERSLTRISGFRATENRVRHFASLAAWPRRFAVVGDAACALNPVYAQGMTVAAIGVSALDRIFRRSTPEVDVGNRFRRDLSKIQRLPSILATAEDLRWPGTRGYPVGRTIRLLHRYLYGLLAAATDRPAVDETLARVVHMVDSPMKLLSPHVAGPALARAIRRKAQ